MTVCNGRRATVLSSSVVLWLALSSLAGAQPIIVDHQATRLSAIPSSWITQAKSTLHIAYGHTSHGSQLVEGMDKLYDWKGSLYAFSETATSGALHLDDYAFSGASDLGNPNFTAWEAATRSYLNTHPQTNVVIWSWCGEVSGASAANISTYLSLMSGLERDYPAVKFVYMTGHLDGSGKAGNLNQRNEQIRSYVRANNKILYDFADIESFDPDGLVNYMEKNATDNCDYDAGGTSRNWALDWQASHVENVDWYMCDPAHTQALNGNLKAYAAWWLWARLAGWSGSPNQVADLAVTVTDGASGVAAGQSLTYTVVASNAGPASVSGARVSDSFPAALTGVSWTCAGTGGGSCGAASGTGNINASVTLPVSGTVTFAATATLSASATGSLSNTATVTAPTGYTDPNTGNNTATDTDTIVPPPTITGFAPASGRVGVSVRIAGTNLGTATAVALNAVSTAFLVESATSISTTVPAGATSGRITVTTPSGTATSSTDFVVAPSPLPTIASFTPASGPVGTQVAVTGTGFVGTTSVSFNGTSATFLVSSDGSLSTVVPPGAATGAIQVTTPGGTASSGAFTVTSQTPSTGYFTLTPCRLVDTRQASQGAPALPAGAARLLPLRGRCGIPATARAVSVNLTVTEGTTAGHLRLYPANLPVPGTSTLNYVAGATRANNAVVALDSSGQLAVFCGQTTGSAHFVLDVNGYFQAP
jgi:uncharacterized repeat protein (TIGR01451 family)